MKTFSLEAIKQAMLDKKIPSQTRLAELSDLSKATITRVFNGTAKPEAKTVDALARVLGLTHAQLFGEDALAASSMDLSKEVYIPIRGKVWATPFRISMQRDYGVIRGLPGEQDCFALQVEGDSMIPVYLPGDYVICRPMKADLTPYPDDDEETTYVPYEAVARFNNQDCIVEHNGETNLKRVKIERQKGYHYKIYMTSMNAMHKPVEVHFGDEWHMNAIVIRTHKKTVYE